MGSFGGSNAEEMRHSCRDGNTVGKEERGWEDSEWCWRGGSIVGRVENCREGAIVGKEWVTEGGTCWEGVGILPWRYKPRESNVILTGLRAMCVLMI